MSHSLPVFGLSISRQPLRKLYQSLGVKSSLEDIQVSEEKLPLLIEYSPTVRNRVTLMRLRRCIAE